MKPVLKGYVSDDGFWKISGRIYFNDKILESKITFMIDSGAALTILSPHDAEKLGLGFDTLHDSKEIDMGGAGKCKGRELRQFGIIFDNEKDTEDVMEVCHRIYVADPASWQSNYSLLGQDVLKKYTIIVNNNTKKISMRLIGNHYITVPR